MGNKDVLTALRTEELVFPAFRGDASAAEVHFRLVKSAEHLSRWREIAHRYRWNIDPHVQPCPYYAVFQVVTFIGSVVLTPAEDAPAMSRVELRVLTFFPATRALTHNDLRGVGCSRDIAFSRQSNII